MQHHEQSRFIGCVLSLALGDAFGAPREGGVLERSLWRAIGTTSDGRRRWTDDTQMTLDLAESLIACRGVDQDDIARRFARGYRWSRGYGPGAARTLKLIRGGVDWRLANKRAFRDGSFGNGGAMRAPVVGLFCSSADLAVIGAAARATALITHSHPLGREGAVLVALATALLLQGAEPRDVIAILLESGEQEPFRERLLIAESWTRTAESWASRGTPSPLDVRERLGNGIAASESCITAVYVALRFLERPLVDLLDFVAAIGGDVDTIGAMAAALWGARNGDAALPGEMLDRLEAANRLRQVAIDLHHAASAAPQGTAPQSVAPHRAGARQ